MNRAVYTDIVCKKQFTIVLSSTLNYQNPNCRLNIPRTASSNFAGSAIPSCSLTSVRSVQQLSDDSLFDCQLLTTDWRLALRGTVQLLGVQGGGARAPPPWTSHQRGAVKYKLFFNSTVWSCKRHIPTTTFLVLFIFNSGLSNQWRRLGMSVRVERGVLRHLVMTSGAKFSE